jgi:hypothetical protein
VDVSHKPGEGLFVGRLEPSRQGEFSFQPPVAPL